MFGLEASRKARGKAAEEKAMQYIEKVGLTKFANSYRSEERRVGKECRSLCDWSSDVCSSDLNVRARGLAQGARQGGRGKGHAVYREGGADQVRQQLQIGRASCRERV